MRPGPLTQQIEMATAFYDQQGIQFEYPGDWDVEVSDDGPVRTVAAQSPSGLAFVLVTTDSSRPSSEEMADQALEAMREEYPALDSIPARETIGGHRAVGHDVEFISLDMTNSCTIRCFQTPRRTILLFGQSSDLEGESTVSQLRDVRRSFAESDG